MEDKGGYDFLREIKEGYVKDKIYFQESEVLIAINPFKTMHELYTAENIKQYGEHSIDALPAHVFALANEVRMNQQIFNTPQSIVINGESGSGKTETSKLLLKFFCGSKATEFTRLIIDANVLLESFGNSSTIENSNSSRFIKTIQVNLNSDGIASSLELNTYLVESGRVCIGAFDNFHIFYFLVNGASGNWRKSLQFENYSFSCLPKQAEQNAQTMTDNFKRVDQVLTSLKLSEEERTIIYKYIAAILHLSNIEFESTDTGTNFSESTKEHVFIAAKLLNIKSENLEKVFLRKLFEAGNDKIESSLNVFEASKARNTVAKLLYSRLFRFIVSCINQIFIRDSRLDQNASVQILDIAGFECFGTSGNRFEQICINYANEKIQNFCTQRLICDELNWYKTENIAIPGIQFPGNDAILAMLEDKAIGIFSLLDEECTMPAPRTDNFIQRVILNHAKCSAFSLPKKSFSNFGFIIHHFGHQVQYSPENFIERNVEECSKPLINMANEALKCLDDLCTAKSIPNISSIKTSKSKTFSAKFRLDLQQLISTLKKTNPCFIRCLKPNSQQMPGLFDDKVVLNQLASSGTLAYHSLMRMGYPTKTSIAEYYQKLQFILEPRYTSIGITNCCRIFLLANGLVSKDFKIGKTNIHLRQGRKLPECLDNKALTKKLKVEFKAFMRRMIYIRIKFIGACALKLIDQDRPVKSGSGEIIASSPFEVQENQGDSSDEALARLQIEARENQDDSLTIREEPGKKDAKVNGKKKNMNKKLREIKPKLSLRFDGVEHLPDYDDPHLRKGFRCKLCGKQTVVFCEKCDVHLCFVTGKAGRNCFKKFHKLNEN